MFHDETRAAGCIQTHEKRDKQMKFRKQRTPRPRHATPWMLYEGIILVDTSRENRRAVVYAFSARLAPRFVVDTVPNPAYTTWRQRPGSYASPPPYVGRHRAVEASS